MSKKSALLLFLSRRGKAPKKYYGYENNKSYEGQQTNDAPFQCLFDIAEHSITKVLCLVSKTVFFEETSCNEDTIFQRYEKMAKEKNNEIEVIPIPYDFSLEDKNAILDSKKQAVSIYQKISEELDEEYEIYVDFTGGMRDIAFLMTTIIRYLEFRGNSCKKIIYSNLDDAKIYNIDYIYNLFQMINGVSEFITTGNVNQLIVAFEATPNMEENKEIKALLDSLKDFSQTLSLCDVVRLDEVLNNLKENINQFQLSKSDNIQSAMFRSMIPEVKKRMYMENDEELSYPNLILWCVENRFIQQALTIYIEKMPVFYEQKAFYPQEVIEMGKNAKLKNGKSREVDLLYTQFFEYLYEDKEEKAIVDFKEELNEMRKRIGRGNGEKKLNLWEAEIKRQILNNENSKFIQEAWRILLKVLRYYRTKEKGLLSSDLNAWINRENAPKDFFACVGEIKKDITNLLGKNYKGTLIENKDKRIVALENIEKRKLPIKIEERKILYKEILSYYLAIKRVRNQVNHASGLTGITGNEEKELKEILLWLKENKVSQIDFSFDSEKNMISFDNIMELLRNGVEVSKKLM